MATRLTREGCVYTGYGVTMDEACQEAASLSPPGCRHHGLAVGAVWWWGSYSGSEGRGQAAGAALGR